jgi:hypothetical protein
MHHFQAVPWLKLNLVFLSLQALWFELCSHDEKCKDQESHIHKGVISTNVFFFGILTLGMFT